VKLVVDGNNVIGSVPDGWWRDRRGAARRLLGRLQRYAVVHDGPVTVVFDVPDPELPEGEHDRVVVRYATRRGRDAADERIVELLDADAEAPVAEEVEVVTSDRALADAARARGAQVTGAGTLLARLDDAGC
jgi:predicted RNA-binding protein with PIN domain